LCIIAPGIILLSVILMNVIMPIVILLRFIPLSLTLQNVILMNVMALYIGHLSLTWMKGQTLGHHETPLLKIVAIAKDNFLYWLNYPKQHFFK
jgi:hypothetical protein